MIALLLLVIVANSAPVVARNLLGAWGDRPLDAGVQLADGQRLFGSTKTWRGLVAGTAATALVAPLLGFPAIQGALAGLYALCGDLVASFIKRRLKHASGARAPLLDSVPEALLPALLLRREFGLAPLDIALLVLGFFLIVRFTWPLLYRLHIRRHPW